MLEITNIFFAIISVLVVMLFIAYFLRLAVRPIFANSRYFKHVVFLVRLPKDRPGDKDKEYTLAMLREEIGKGETLFAAIGGLRAQRSFRSWLLGRNDHYSFEIVAHKKRIAFYAVAPLDSARYLEQQIHAHYPDAVIEPVRDYNIFLPETVIKAGYIRTKRHFMFPLRTYHKQESDPMNSLINVLSKLGEHEAMAIQYTVRSAFASWHAAGKGVGRLLMDGKSIHDAVKMRHPNPAVALWHDLWITGRAKTKEQQMRAQSMPRLSAMEEEMVKGIEEKNSKAGLDVNLRIVVSAESEANARLYLDNLSSAFAQYNLYEYGNSFASKVRLANQDRLVGSFIYRRFDERIKFLLNTEELASLYHLPLRVTETPNILWLTARHAPAPNNIPEEGIVLGRNVFRGQETPVRMKRDDRRRHMYLIGKSGVGKSHLLTGLAVQDIMNGEGVCVIDPHGDLVNDVLDRVPAERAEDVVLFAPADIERPLGLNLLEFDARYPEQKTFVINEMIKIFDKLYDLKATGGPIFEQYMRNAMLLIMAHPESGSTLMEVPKVLADASFRNMKLKHCPDETVVDFWRQEAEKAGGDAALANVVPYVTSKLTQFISNDTMRPIIGQQRSAFNFRDVMDNRKILLVNLAKGAVGEMNAYLLGMILVGKILMSALSRTDLPQDQRKDFYLYIDEFQNFTTDSICSILSEARKYNLNLIIAHQYLGQLVKGQDSAIKEAVFGNAGTWISFKVGSEDAQVLEKEYSPVFNQYDLINIEKYTAYAKLLIDNTASRPFTLNPLHPLPGTANPILAQKIKTLSRLKFGQDRSIIEAEIRARRQLTS